MIKKVTVKFRIKSKMKRKEIKFEYKPLLVESGVFSETSHYSKPGAVLLYTYLLYGTNQKKYPSRSMPSRNILPDIEKFVEDNLNDFVSVYVQEKNSEDAGHIIGSKINNFHKLTMKNYSAIPNTMLVAARKGFNDPFILTGALMRALAYKLNGSGLYGGG